MVDRKDDFKNDFQILGMKFAKKSILGPKWELTQNVGTKSAFSPKKNCPFIEHATPITKQPAFIMENYKITRLFMF